MSEAPPRPHAGAHTHPAAKIGENATVGKGARIAEGDVVEAHARIAANTTVKGRGRGR